MLSFERRQAMEIKEQADRKAALELVKDCKNPAERAEILAQHAKLHVLKPNHQVAILLTIIRDKTTDRESFMFQSNRIMRMLMSVSSLFPPLFSFS